MKKTSPAVAPPATAVIANIYERRAVRKYKPNPVDKKLVEMILDAGRMAPSAINRQPWKFYILTNKKNIEKFSKEIAKVTSKTLLKTGIKNVLSNMANLLRFTHVKDLLTFTGSIFHGAPVVIFITSPRSNEWAALDVGMCAQNMMLAAKSLGLETCPVGLAKFVEQTSLYPTLKIPSGEQVNLAVILGYGDETPEVHKRIRNNAIYIDQ